MFVRFVFVQTASDLSITHDRIGVSLDTVHSLNVHTPHDMLEALLHSVYSVHSSLATFRLISINKFRNAGSVLVFARFSLVLEPFELFLFLIRQVDGSP